MPPCDPGNYLAVFCHIVHCHCSQGVTDYRAKIEGDYEKQIQDCCMKSNCKKKNWLINNKKDIHINFTHLHQH